MIGSRRTRRRCLDIAAIVAALTIGMATAAGLANGDSVVAIRGGAIMPVTAPPIEDGVVLIRNGKIEAVGRDVKVPDGAEVMDAAGKVIIPAMIDAGAGDRKSVV